VTSRTLTLRGYSADSEEKIRVVAGATVAGARREFTQPFQLFCRSHAR
jgi:hypothetical protein